MENEAVNVISNVINAFTNKEICFYGRLYFFTVVIVISLAFACDMMEAN